jgi:hypothetical protein
MNKKIIVPIVLLTLISLITLVSATTILTKLGDNFNGYESEVYLSKGWNLVPVGNNLGGSIDMERDIRAIFYFNYIDQEYFGGESYSKPANNEYANIVKKYGEQRAQEMGYRQPAWIYSEKEGTYKVEYGVWKLNSHELVAGWNFATITPEYIDKSFNDLKGNCDFEKAYVWNQQQQEWGEQIDFNENIDNDLLLNGMIIKVSSDCNLGSSGGSTTSPPGLPIDCQEDDGGKNINVKGTTAGMSSWGVGDESSVQVSVTDVCEEDLYDNYLREYYCLDNLVQNEGNFCPDGTTCSNGACN